MTLTMVIPRSMLYRQRCTAEDARQVQSRSGSPCQHSMSTSSGQEWRAWQTPHLNMAAASCEQSFVQARTDLRCLVVLSLSLIFEVLVAICDPSVQKTSPTVQGAPVKTHCTGVKGWLGLSVQPS